MCNKLALKSTSFEFEWPIAPASCQSIAHGAIDPSHIRAPPLEPIKQESVLNPSLAAQYEIITMR